MNKKYFKYLVFASLITLFAASAFSQGASDMGRAQSELERTDQMLALARDAVRIANDVQAQVVLEKQVEGAEYLQSQAKEFFQQGGTSGYKAAIELTQEARELAKKAMTSARYTQQNQDAVQRKIERAEQLLERAQEEVRLQQNQGMAAIYESAENSLRTAQEFYRDGEYKPALKLANQVENAVQRIISASNRILLGPANLDRYRQDVEAVLEGTRKQIATCDSETALKLMEQAQSSYELAVSLATDDNKQKMTMEAFQAAKKLATRARLECGGFDGTLSERYERLLNEADRISETIPADDQNARQLLDQVYEQLDLARGYIDNGDTEAAAASLKAAQLTLNQLMKLLDVDTD